MGHWPQQAIFREGVLLLSCICSDLLPGTLLSGFLRSQVRGAVVDNMSHAGIAAASWAVVVSLSPPPSQAAASFLPIALPGSPVHRCVSSALRRYTNKAPPPPTPTPPTHPRTPAAGSTLTETRSRDLDAVVPYLHTRPRGEGRGGSAARSEEGGRERGGSASGVVEIVFAAFVGSALDLDHFLAAGSLRLSRATGLPGRPWGHCVAALVVAALAAAALTRNARAATSVFSAGLSHQLRDATRRGLWLYPPRGPKTLPLGYPVYLVAQTLLPLLVALCVGGGFISRCGSFVRGCSRSRGMRRWRWSCARSRSGDEDEDRDRRALLPW